MSAVQEARLPVYQHGICIIGPALVDRLHADGAANSQVLNSTLGADRG